MVRVSAFCSDTIRNWSVTGSVETLLMMTLLRGYCCLYPLFEPWEFFTAPGKDRRYSCSCEWPNSRFYRLSFILRLHGVK